jgi:hypothetical protein
MRVPGRERGSWWLRAGERVVVAVGTRATAVVVFDGPTQQRRLALAERAQHRELANREGPGREITGKPFDPGSLPFAIRNTGRV